MPRKRPPYPAELREEPDRIGWRRANTGGIVPRVRAFGAGDLEPGRRQADGDAGRRHGNPPLAPQVTPWLPGPGLPLVHHLRLNSAQRWQGSVCFLAILVSGTGRR